MVTNESIEANIPIILINNRKKHLPSWDLVMASETGSVSVRSSTPDTETLLLNSPTPPRKGEAG